MFSISLSRYPEYTAQIISFLLLKQYLYQSIKNNHSKSFPRKAWKAVRSASFIQKSFDSGAMIYTFRLLISHSKCEGHT